MALLSRPRPCQAGRGEGFYIAAWTGLTEQPFEQRHENHTDERHTAAGHKLFHTKIGVKLCSMAGGGVSRNLWNFFRTAPAGTGQAVTCSTSGMGLRLK